MKTKDIMTIVTVALGTMSLTVMTFWSGPLTAGGEGDTSAPQIAKPKLVSHGIEMTLATAENRTFSAGQEPVLELTAVNTTGESATASVHITMTASSPADLLSRVPRLPSALWRQDQTLALQPNETKVLAIPVPAKLPPNSMIAVSFQAPDPSPATAQAADPGIPSVVRFAKSPQSGIVALNFSTAVPAGRTAAVN